VAARLGLEPFYFVNRHVLYLFPALAVLLTTALLPERNIRRVALVVFLREPSADLATLMFGAEVKGARRWIVILGVNVSPSEFLKARLRHSDRPGCSAKSARRRKCRRIPLRWRCCWPR